MKKVAIIGTAGVPSKYGGFETLVHQLVSGLNNQFDFTVYCTTKLYAKENRVKTWKNARMVYLPINANGIQSVLYDIVSILHALLYADTLMIFGVGGGFILPFVKLFTNKKIIVHIDGLEWRRAKWGKLAKWFLRNSEKIAVKYSDADIADNVSIKRYTAVRYKTLSHLIAYGGDHVKPKKITPEIRKKYPFLSKPYAFKVARIEPENNVEMILEAFAKMPERNLVIIGNWAKSQYGQKLRKQYGSCKNIHLLSPIYDLAILDQFRSNCHLYLHGHSAGGTNPSLVEAMHLGLPILAYSVSYNKESTHHKAMYFKNAEDLCQIVRTTSLRSMIQIRYEMKALANEYYTWDTVCKMYSGLILSFDFKYYKQTVKGALSKRSKKVLQKDGLAHLKNPQLSIS